MLALGIVVAAVLHAEPVCVEPAWVIGPGVQQVKLVTRPTYPTDDCGDFTGAECPFGDVNVQAAQRLSVVDAMRPLGFARVERGRVCLPAGLESKDVLVRLDKGDVDLLATDVFGGRTLTVHADGRVLVTPGNIIGHTDGGVWRGDLAGTPSVLTVIPDDPQQSAQIVVLDDPKAGAAELTRPREIALEHLQRGHPFKHDIAVTDTKGAAPFSVVVHAWPDRVGRPVQTPPITRLWSQVSDRLMTDREYVVEARQGDARAAAPLEARLPQTTTLRLTAQAHVELEVVDGRIWVVKLVEGGTDGNPWASKAPIVDLATDDRCRFMRGWEWLEPKGAPAHASISVPPGPDRIICVLTDPNPKNPLWLAIPAPLKPGSYALRLKDPPRPAPSPGP
jgi:hypothetical protein